MTRNASADVPWDDGGAPAAASSSVTNTGVAGCDNPNGRRNISAKACPCAAAVDGSRMSAPSSSTCSSQLELRDERRRCRLRQSQRTEEHLREGVPLRRRRRRVADVRAQQLDVLFEARGLAQEPTALGKEIVEVHEVALHRAPLG